MAENKNVRPPMGGMRHGAGRVVELSLIHI